MPTGEHDDQHEEGVEMKRAAVVTTLGALFLLTSTIPASAHYLSSQWIQSYTSSDICVNEYTELSHSSTYPGGHFIGSVSAWTNFIHNCTAHKLTTLAVRINGYVWNATYGRWDACTPTVQPASDYKYVYNTYQYQYRFNFTRAPCGSAWYTMSSQSWAKNGSTWYGGWLITLWDYSPQEWQHWLPTS